MRIYIDESGSFATPTTREHSFSLVLALVIPSASENELFYEFLRLRDQWPVRGVEIKGSSLNETQCAEVIDLVSRYGALVEFTAVDVGMHVPALVDDFKTRQATAITGRLTQAHHPDMVRQLEGLVDIIRKMSNQLFVQAFVTIQLVLESVQTTTLYFAQRSPAELGDVAWTIDQKEKSITQMEEMWTTLILPMSESHFIKKPLTFLVEGDYSHFARYETAVDALDEEMRRHLQWVRETYGVQEPAGRNVLEPKRLLTEQQTFGDSKNLLGLQLADMLANVLRRALNDRLRRPGWEHFGRLTVEKLGDGTSFLQLGDAAGALEFSPQATEVWAALRAERKPILAG